MRLVASLVLLAWSARSLRVARRAVLAGCGGAVLLAPAVCRADKPDAVQEFKAAAGLRGGPVLNADGEYEDDTSAESWQEAWSGRAAKASSMSPDQILMAARGAGNGAPASDSKASRKRRALAACRSDALRLKVPDAGDAKACTGRVLDGEIDFMLKAYE